MERAHGGRLCKDHKLDCHLQVRKSIALFFQDYEEKLWSDRVIHGLKSEPVSAAILLFINKVG